MTREQEIQFTELFKEKLKDAQFQGLPKEYQEQYWRYAKRKVTIQ